MHDEMNTLLSLMDDLGGGIILSRIGNEGAGPGPAASAAAVACVRE